MKAPLKVAHVYPGGVDIVGGSENQSMVFFRCVEQARIQPHLVLLGDNPAFSEQASMIPSLAIHRLGQAGRHTLAVDVLWRFFAAIKRHEFGVVHLFGLRHEILTRGLSRAGGVPAVVSAIRGTETHRTKFHGVLNRWTGRWVDCWVSNSEAARQVFEIRDRLPSERIEVVHNGVRIPDIIPCRAAARQRLCELCNGDASVPVVGCVANLLPHKRQVDLVAAMARVIARGVDLQLVLIGRDGPYRQKIENAINEYGMRNRVHLLGFRPDVGSLLPALDVFVLPSEREGMPSAVVEAMAMGVPVVGTNVADMARVVADGTTGWLVDVGDISEMARRVEFLIRNPLAADGMGAKARQHAKQHYSDTAMTQNLTALYESLAIRG